MIRSSSYSCGAFRAQNALVAGLILIGWGTLVRGAFLWREDFSTFSEGSDRLALIDGWDSDTVGYGSHGIVEDVLPERGRSGYIGLNPPPDNVVGLWRPVDIPINRLIDGVLEVAAVVAVVDSSNDRWDNFFVTFGNTDGDPLAAINFDNTNFLIFVDDGKTVTNTEFTFVPDSFYTLMARIDLWENRWTVTLDETTIVEDSPFHSGGNGLDLGRIGFEWWVSNLDQPGDNFLIFDDVSITAPSGLISTTPIRLTIERTQDGGIRILWEGTGASSYVVERAADLKEWTALGEAELIVPEDGTGFYVYSDQPESDATGYFYRVRAIDP